MKLPILQTPHKITLIELQKRQSVKHYILCALLLMLSCLILSTATATQKTLPLPVEQAFQFSLRTVDTHTLEAHWQISPGYYLYRERIHITTLAPAQLGPITLPPGIERNDEVLGKYQVYQDTLTLKIPVIATDNNKLSLQVNYQGCFGHSFCYPPVSKKINVNFETTETSTSNVTTQVRSPASSSISEQDRITQLLQEKNIFLIILGFIGFGLLLTFTPCVLPMIPILAGIIIGEGSRISARKGFLLSLCYVMSMSLTYAIAGIVAGLLGSSLQAMLQNPWVISLFSLIFVLLALSLFGFYEIRLPSSWQNQLDAINRRQRSGNYWSVAIMGCIATLVVSPCVTPPLVGALGYIGQTGDALLGGVALFSFGFGMGIPLILVGISGGRLLPKAGPWMDIIKLVFGVIMLAVAIWMLSRILPGQLTLVLWAALSIHSGVYMGALHHEPKSNWQLFWKGAGLILFIYGIILLVGAALGNKNPLEPLGNFRQIPNTMPVSQAPMFQKIKTQQELAASLELAKKQQRPVILDFYADWCIACKEMESVFADTEVRKMLAPYLLLQADITKYDAADQELMHALNVIAPPSLIFYTENSLELSKMRLVGAVSTTEFLRHLTKIRELNSSKNF